MHKTIYKSISVCLYMFKYLSKLLTKRSPLQPDMFVYLCVFVMCNIWLKSDLGQELCPSKNSISIVMHAVGNTAVYSSNGQRRSGSIAKQRDTAYGSRGTQPIAYVEKR